MKTIIKIITVFFVTFVLVSISGCLTIYQSIGHNFGAFIATVSGKEYSQVANRWDYENKALLYVYRPNSQWAADEVEAPSFYLDDERVFNIRANGYTWFELEPGEYKVVMRRPLLGLEGIVVDTFEFDLKRIAELNLQVEADHVYYLRYSEIDPPELEFQSLDANEAPMGDGPLMLVSNVLAKDELAVTRMLPEGGRFIKAQDPLSEDELEEVFDSRVIDLTQESAPEENTMKWWW